MPYVSINRANIYYENHGAGEPLLYIGGIGGHTAEAEHLAQAYASRLRFIAFDARGCGRSGGAAPAETIAAHADDAAAVMDALRIESAFVYGSSLGGMVAQELAIRHPRRVRALILGSTTAGAMRGQVPSMRTLRKLVRNQALSGREAMIANWELGYSRPYIEANYEAMLARRRRLAPYATRRSTYLRQAFAAARHDAWGRLHRITCPVLILHGQRDLLVPLRNARRMKQRMPHAELHVFAGMGHGFHLEAQAEADAIVFDFIRRHTPIPETSSALR
jgi:pimeloyl-ACP methyl ester carboxylesterase